MSGRKERKLAKWWRCLCCRATACNKGLLQGSPDIMFQVWVLTCLILWQQNGKTVILHVNCATTIQAGSHLKFFSPLENEDVYSSGVLDMGVLTKKEGQVAAQGIRSSQLIQLVISNCPWNPSADLFGNASPLYICIEMAVTLAAWRQIAFV